MKDRGFAVLVALLITLVLNAIGLGLLSITNTEGRIALNHRESAELLEAATAALDSSIGEVAGAAWDDVLGGLVTSRFQDSTLAPLLPSNETLAVAAETVRLQSQSDAEAQRGLDNPRWRLFTHAPLSVLTRTTAPREYVLTWVADDVTEGDNDPNRDSNGLIVVRARAIGRGASARSVEAVLFRDVARTRILSWREVQ